MGHSTLLKRLIIPGVILVSSQLLYTSTFASENDQHNAAVAQETLDNSNFKGEIVYQDQDITVRNYGNNDQVSKLIDTASNTVSTGTAKQSVTTPENPIFSNKSTTVGNGGVAKLNAGNSGRILYWSVNPNTAWLYNFQGSIHLSYYSGFQRTAAVGGFGSLHQTVSGSITMNKNRGGYASLSGEAVSITGKNFFVLPGVGTSF